MGFEIGKTIAGYEIVEVLGRSKTGVTYKVRNVFAQRFEVLKILPRSIQDDEEQNARFLREIKLHAQLLHPNIVTFYNAREIEDQLVMTTEFVPGVTVAEKLQAGPIAWRDADKYICQALAALEYAHAHGIIHRGLSSSNLIVTDEGVVRLTGFGLAKSASDPQLTAAGAVIGALKYMSPEQVKGDSVDARCDIYSLGIVFYEMLTGKLPFEAKGQFDIMLAHVNTPPKHARDVNPAVPRELGDVVMKALVKAPDERFQTARDFRDAVEQVGLRRDAVVPESKPTSDELASSLADTEAAKPVVESAPLMEPAPPARPTTVPAAWTLESALELAKSKLATMKLHSALPVAESSVLAEPSAPALSTAPADPWKLDSKPQSTPVLPAIEAEERSAAPPAVLPASPDLSILEAVLTPVESKPAVTVSEPAHAAVEVAALNEAPVVVAATTLPDAQAIESTVVSAESKPPSTVLTAPPELPSPLAILAEPPAVEQSAALNWRPVSSPLPPAESKTPETEFALSPSEPEPSTPVVTTLAIADSPVLASPSTPPDWWSTESHPAPVESKTESTQLELLSAGLEPGKPPVKVANVTDTPTSHTSALHPDLWCRESAWISAQSKPAATEPASSLFAPEPTPLAATSTDLAEAPLSLWTSGPPDTWISEPSPAPSAPKPETDLPSLSAALEPLQAPLESAVPPEAPAAPSTLPQEQSVVESKPAASEPVPQSPPASPMPAAAAAVATPPVAVAPKPAPVNPDLLTALFGDSLLSRLSLTLVVCAIILFLGTVTLFAVLSVTRP